jgi:hypothetical protein
VWVKAVELEKKHGSVKSVEEVSERKREIYTSHY